MFRPDRMPECWRDASLERFSGFILDKKTIQAHDGSWKERFIRFHNAFGRLSPLNDCCDLPRVPQKSVVPGLLFGPVKHKDDAPAGSFSLIPTTLHLAQQRPFDFEISYEFLRAGERDASIGVGTCASAPDSQPLVQFLFVPGSGQYINLRQADPTPEIIFPAAAGFPFGRFMGSCAVEICHDGRFRFKRKWHAEEPWSVSPWRYELQEQGIFGNENWSIFPAICLKNSVDFVAVQDLTITKVEVTNSLP